MMNLNKRIEALEAINKPKIPLEWTPEEKQFINEIQTRREKAGTKFYHKVCNDEEFERIKRLSMKSALIWYRDKKKNESNESI